jgi:HPt (histidine-containing phosphotransfer) domain-containing protein
VSMQGVYDPGQLLETVDGDTELARELAALYLSLEPELMRELQQAVTGSDPQRVQRVCHSLKGMLGQIQAAHAAGIAATIEAAAPNAQLASLAPMVEDLARSLKVVRDALSAGPLV